jgi:uncharacterized membrane protein YdjX (TVP38/TMEM64 family)
VRGPGRRLLGPAALLVVLAAGTLTAFAVGLPPVEEIRAGLAAFGAAGPLVLGVAYAAATLAWLPRNVLSATCGLLLGFAGGVPVALAGSLLGGVTGFALVRLLGRDAVGRLARGRLARADALLLRRGFVAVLTARLLPVVPFTAVTYAAGLSAVRSRDHLLGTAVGIVPGTLAYAAVGAYGAVPGTWPVAGAVLALALGATLLTRGLRARRTRARTAAAAASVDVG